MDFLKQCFETLVPAQDGRAIITPLEFVVCLVFCYLGDAKTFSLEAIRRQMKHQLDKEIKRSSFWGRLASARLKRYLRAIVAQLITQLSGSTLVSNTLLKALKVKGIGAVDSSTITLRDQAKNSFPGTGSDAGIKWHACFNLLTGTLEWYQLTASRTHDRKCFPPVEWLAQRLVIFDLGYWDYGLLLTIEKAKGFFLSRLKSNAVVTIQAVVSGLSKRCVGQSLLSVDLSGKRGQLIEVLIEKVYRGETLRCRALGFWNPVEKTYHWYLTNLAVAAHIIYPLYRLRWQIELIFKACKNSLNANQITSADKNIIESLLLASLAAQLSTYTILEQSIEHLDTQQQQSISFQRLAQVAVILRQEFILFLLNTSTRYKTRLIEKIILFSNEIYDPNYRRRSSSLGRIIGLLT